MLETRLIRHQRWPFVVKFHHIIVLAHDDGRSIPAVRDVPIVVDSVDNILDVFVKVGAVDD